MTYAVICFDAQTRYALGVCSLSNHSEFVTEYQDAMRHADRLSATWSPAFAYAVYYVSWCEDARAGRLRSDVPVSVAYSLSYIPEVSHAMLYAPSGSFRGLSGSQVDDAKAGASAAALGALWPVNLNASTLFLEDGTACEFDYVGQSYRDNSETRHNYAYVYITGDVGDVFTAGQRAAFWLSDGRFVGDEMSSRYPRLCNFAPVAAAAPAPASVAAARGSGSGVRFEVRSGLNGTDRDTWGAVADFDSGKDAAAWVADNRAAYTGNGKSLVIVKVELGAVAVDWRARERDRLADGTYLPLPGDWAEAIARAYPNHFAHMASSDKRKVAFTESESSGERDRQKVLSAAEYVSRFFSKEGWGADSWGRSKRSDFVSAMLGDSFAPYISPLGDAAAMVAAYRLTEGGEAHGCMSYTARNYDTGGVHPSEVYALGGELAFAALLSDSSGSFDPDLTLEEAGGVLARCLVWIKDGTNLEYGRVYGGVQNARMLRTVLEAQGFTQGDCIGARIAKVDAPCGDYVMPYLDIGAGTVSDCGEYFEAGGDTDAQQTNGLLGMPRAVCESCDETYDPEEEGSSVYVNHYDTQSWCDCCVRNHAFHCEYLEEYVTDDRAMEVVRYGSTVTVADWLPDRGSIDVVRARDGTLYWGGFDCEDCGDGFCEDDLHSWDGERDTGDSSHACGDSLCGDCHAAREALADGVAAEASETETVETAAA